MTSSEYFNELGEKDIKWWDGITRTFNRRTSVGGLLSLNKIGPVVDVAAAYGSGTPSHAALANAVAQIGSTECGLLLQPGTWSITANLTIPANLVLICPNGVDLAITAAMTLTVNGGIEAHKRALFSGSGSVSIGGGNCEIWAEWFAGADIGAKVNAAITAANAAYPMTIRVLPASWDGQSYDTGIVINKVVSLRLPFAEAYPATFTGATAAVKFSTTYAAHLHNLSVDLTGNLNASVDGLQLLQSGRNRISGKIYIKGAIRDGIRIDSNNVSGSGSNNHFEAECRVVNAAVCSLHFLNGAGGATNTPNSNYFEKFRSSGIAASGTDIYFEEGYSNFVNHVYIESHGANAWAIHNASGANSIGPCTLDSTCINGAKQTGGSLVFIGTFNNNASGTKYSGDVFYTSDGGVYGQSLMFNNIMGALPTLLGNPQVFSTAGGAAAPFNEWGNLIDMPRADSSPRDRYFYTGDPPTARLKISRTGVITADPDGTPVQLYPLIGANVQEVNSQTGAKQDITAQIPYDDTIPQNTEGAEVLTAAITPKAATNYLKIEALINIGATTAGGASHVIVALFQDTTANALAVGAVYNAASGNVLQVHLIHYMLAGTTSSTTFKIRAGGNAGNSTINGVDANRKFGGVYISSLTVTEIVV